MSRTDLALEIHRRLDPIIDVLVPVFFCVMGMLIDLHTLAALWKAGLVFSVLSVFSKFFGCALPELAFGFNWRGAIRVGLGMVPRGEVALIIAGLAVATQRTDAKVFRSASPCS